MSLAINEDQELLQAAVRKILSEASPLEGVRSVVTLPEGYDRSLWRRLADELGILTIGIPENLGGAGGGLSDQAVVFEALGRFLTPGPYLSTIALTVQALRESADEVACARWLPMIASGEMTGTVAALETDADWGLHAVNTVASRSADGEWALDGEKRFVTDGATADLILVLAQHDGAPGLFAVQRGTAGVHSSRVESLDSTRGFATVTMRHARASLVGQLGDARRVVGSALDYAAVALGCQQVGGANRCLEMAVEYAKIRVQFDRPIGSFQAIKHILADRLLDNESAAAAVGRAVTEFGTSRAGSDALVSLSKASCSDAFFDASAANIQVHGGIGFTWEHDAHLYFKRASVDKVLFGSPKYHRERIASHLLRR